MHNLEDYFETLYEVNAECLTHIRPYLDVTSDIIENQDEPSVESLRKIISRLRVADETFGSGQELKDIPALLVMGTGVQRSLVGKELVSCGFRVVTSHNPIEAIGVAISAKPKFAIINKLLPGISGVELTHIFKALDTLSDCKIILLTSDNDANAIQQTIPDNSIVMHKDAKFYENLTDQLIDWGLFGDFA
jgi:PleD family two-component response regulator